MSDFFGLVFGAVLVNNLVLTYLVGLDLQVAASKRMDAAWLIGLATLYSLMLCLPAVYLIDQLIIIPFSLQFLDLLFYVMLIIIVVYGSQNIVRRLFPRVSQHTDTLIPVILLNSILLAVILINQDQNNSFLGALINGIAIGAGFLFLLLTLTCLRERIENQDIPAPFKGLPILLISLGIFSMGLMGLAGL